MGSVAYIERNMGLECGNIGVRMAENRLRIGQYNQVWRHFLDVLAPIFTVKIVWWLVVVAGYARILPTRPHHKST